MKTIINILFGLLAGLLLGLWTGVNLGKEKPLFSNPFADRSVSEQVKEKASDLYQDTKRAVKDSLE